MDSKRHEPPSPTSRQGPSLAGRYQLLVTLGRGGMADVYLAVARGSLGFNKLVVLKRLRSAADDDGRSLDMFVDEARLAARLNHPNIVDTYDAGQEGNSYFIAMEYLEGQSLRRLLKSAEKAQIPPLTWVRIAADALHGLHHAHELRDYDGTPLEIVHRDVSPDNIFVTYDGGVKVVDFGIAKATVNVSQTEAGVFKGKLSYMAPEQAMGADVDRRADVFSMGVVLWEALAGRKRLEGGVGKALVKLVHADVPSLLSVKPDIDPRLSAIVERALEKDPERRYATAAEMRDALEQYLRDSGKTLGSIELSQLMTQLFSDHRAAVRRQIEQHLATAAQQVSDEDFWDSGKMRIAGDTTGSLLAQTSSNRELSPMQSSTSSLHPQPQPLTGPVTPTPKTQWSRGLVVGVILAVACAFGAALLLRTRTPAPAVSAGIAPVAPAHQSELSVLIETVPAGALVSWNGDTRGRTPIRLRLPPGTQTLMLTKDGFVQQSVVLELKDTDGALARTFTLTPEGGPAPEESEEAASAKGVPASKGASRTRTRVHRVGARPGLTDEPEEEETTTPAPAPVSAPAPVASPTPATPAPAAPVASPAPPQQATTTAPVSVPQPAPAAVPPGTVDQKAVYATLRAHSGQVQACFDRARMDKFDLHGPMTIRVTLDPSGHVIGTGVSNGVEGGARLQACVVSAVQGWTFPAPAGGVNGSAAFPLKFE